MSHEGVIYCKAHHRELFQPKVVKEDIIEVKANVNKAKDRNGAKLDPIIRENDPVDLGDDVVKSSKGFLVLFSCLFR